MNAMDVDGKMIIRIVVQRKNCNAGVLKKYFH